MQRMLPVQARRGPEPFRLTIRSRFGDCPSRPYGLDPPRREHGQPDSGMICPQWRTAVVVGDEGVERGGGERWIPVDSLSASDAASPPPAAVRAPAVMCAGEPLAPA